MARFPTGELLVIYTMVTDYNDNPRNLSGLQFSRDGGKTWGERHDFLAEHQPMIYVPEADGSLVAIPAYLHKQTLDDERNLHAAYTRLEQGGRPPYIYSNQIILEEEVCTLLPKPLANSY